MLHRRYRFVFVLLGIFFLCSVSVGNTQAYQIPPSITLPNSDMVVSKNNIIAIPYIMNDWENCNPETLKRGIDPSVDCWSQVANIDPLPANRPPYAAGSFGSHVTFVWNDLHTGPNQYNWTKLDQYLEMAAGMRVKDARGNTLPFKPVIITFSEFLQRDSNPHDGQKDFLSYIPQFVRDMIPADQLTLSLSGCDVQDMVPYHNQAFQQYYQEFIEAALTHIRQSPYNYLVQAYLMSGGVSSETMPHKSLSDCDYRGYYRDRWQGEYVDFINDSLIWTDAALRHGTSQRDTTAFLQAAPGSPQERFWWFQTAYPLQIGYKMNGAAPANANAINARPTALGFYDAQAMTELTWPKGFEPVSPIWGSSDYRCSNLYCATDARYQGVYWMDLTAMNYQLDMFDRNKENFLWTREFVSNYNLDWYYGLLENSYGKAANQSRVAWIAFVERLLEIDSYPNPRPSPPLEVGTGDYFRAEFEERGDRDFYLYRLGEIEDSTLIRRQAGVFGTDQDNYALLQNNCYRTDNQLSGQSTKMIPGQELRSSGKLANSQFIHPFSATALSTDGAGNKPFISLVLEGSVTSIRNNPSTITVEYLDSGTDQFALEYMNAQGQMQQELVTKTNSRLWKSFQVTKSPSQISWGHQLPGGADLRLNCLCNSAAGDDIFHMVRIESQGPAVQVAPSNELRFCGEAPTGGCSGSADVNNDGSINLVDLSAVISHFGASGSSPYDVNCDQIVDLLDFTTVVSRLNF